MSDLPAIFLIFQLESPKRLSKVAKYTFVNECSGNSWQEVEQFVIGSWQVYPLTRKIEQILILKYLTPMGEYQEVSSVRMTD